MKTFILLVLGLTAFASYTLANDCECGTQNLKTRIINGQEAQRDRYPWIVSLLISAGGNSYSSCGASLISDRHILTAAHCVAENPEPSAVTAMLGAHTNDERMRAGRGQMKLKVISVTVHEDYDHNGSKMDDDIAILEIENPVTFDDTVSPICLPTSSEHPELSVIGWGRQNFGRSLGSAKVLFEVNIDEVDNQTCTNKYWGRTFKPNKEICAGLVKSTCQGDSGGPLFHVTANGRSVQVGIVSFGTPQCGVGDAPKPAVYERVMAHLKWIERHTRGAKWCSGPDTPAFTKKNIAKKGKSYKNGGQGAGPSTQDSRPAPPSRGQSGPRRPPTAGNSPFPSGLDGFDFSKIPSGSGSVRIIRTMGPDGKVTEKIERGDASDMSRDFDDIFRRLGAGRGLF